MERPSKMVEGKRNRGKVYNAIVQLSKEASAEQISKVSGDSPRCVNSAILDEKKRIN